MWPVVGTGPSRPSPPHHVPSHHMISLIFTRDDFLLTFSFSPRFPFPPSAYTEGLSASLSCSASPHTLLALFSHLHVLIALSFPPRTLLRSSLTILLSHFHAKSSWSTVSVSLPRMHSRRPSPSSVTTTLRPLYLASTAPLVSASAHFPTAHLLLRGCAVFPSQAAPHLVPLPLLLPLQSLSCEVLLHLLHPLFCCLVPLASPAPFRRNLPHS